MHDANKIHTAVCVYMLYVHSDCDGWWWVLAVARGAHE